MLNEKPSAWKISPVYMSMHGNTNTALTLPNNQTCSFRTSWKVFCLTLALSFRFESGLKIREFNNLFGITWFDFVYQSFSIILVQLMLRNLVVYTVLLISTIAGSFSMQLISDDPLYNFFFPSMVLFVLKFLLIRNGCLLPCHCFQKSILF